MKATAVDKAKRLDIYCRKDGSFERTLLVKNASDSSDFDFTGFTVEFFVVDAWFKTPRLSLIEGDGLTVTTGRIDIEISAADLNIKKEDLYYFMWVTSPDGSKYVWLNGRFVVNHQLFDGVTSTNELTINNTPDTINIIISADGSGEATMPTFDSGIELGEDNVARLGGTAKRDTTILGDGYDMIFGSTDSRVRNFLLRVADVFEVLIPSSGAWRAVVGTAQIAFGESGMSFFNDNIFEFRKQGDMVNILEITTKEDDIVAPKVTVNELLELNNIDTQEAFDRIQTNVVNGKYRDGSIAFYNVPGQQPQLIYNYGGSWQVIGGYVDLGRYTIPSPYAPTGFLQAIRNYEIQGNSSGSSFLKTFDRLFVTFVVDLAAVATSEFGIRLWHDPPGADPIETTDVCTINTNTPGKYVIEVKLSVGIFSAGEEDLKKLFITVTVSGPGDENSAGYATADYPIEDINTDGITAIQVIGQCSISNTLRVIFQDSHIMRQQLSTVE